MMLKLKSPPHSAYSWYKIYDGPNGTFRNVQGYYDTRRTFPGSEKCWFPVTWAADGWFDFVNTLVAFATEEEGDYAAKRLSEDALYEAVLRAQV